MSVISQIFFARFHSFLYEKGEKRKMADAFKCDRCKEFFEGSGEAEVMIRTQNMPNLSCLTRNYHQPLSNGARFVLCVRCSQNLIIYLEYPKSEVKT